MAATNQPFISIITPFFNSHTTIKETIESVKKQTYLNFEHIIVDDGSAQPVSDTIKNYLQSSQIKIIRQDNQGVAVARNTAIKHATGDYLVFLDADDLISPNYLEKIIAVFTNKPDTSMVACYVQEFGRSQNKVKIKHFDIEDFYYRNGLFPSIIALKRADFIQVGGYNPLLKVCEDWDLYLKIAMHNPNVHIIPEYLFYYRKHDNGSSLTDLMSRDKLTVHKAHYLMYQSNQEFYNERLLSPLNVSYLLLKSEKRMQKTLRNFKLLNLVSVIAAFGLVINYTSTHAMFSLILGLLWFCISIAGFMMIKNTNKKLKQFSLPQLPNKTQLFQDQ